MTAAAELPLRPMTLDDVTRIAEADHEHRFELSEGNLIVVPPGTWRHQEISGLLCAWFVSNGYQGRVEPDDTVIQLELDGDAYTQTGTTTLDTLLAGPAPDLS